ncbi:hypothetical protein [Gordonia sp. 'Campus']|uniref:hypothetical protein n=1 Tax=Gordonia sp. 'Campus' TaxID=2915824 RepID=UPI001EE47C42|nr:hypothetical protein [Gordonia sp. 'Campus']
MASDRGKKKPTPKRRPTPKVAGRTVPAKNSEPDAPSPGADAQTTPSIPESETAQPSTPEPETTLPSTPEVRGAKATSHEGPADEPLEASTAETAETTTDAPESTDPADTSTVSITKPKTKPVARVSTLRRGDASSAASTEGTKNRSMGRRPGRRDKGPRRDTRQRNGRRVLGIPVAVLFGVAAVLGIIAVVLAFHPGARIGENKAFVEQEATSQLTSQAQERICAVFGYDHTELDKWQQRAQDALTGQARTEFDETLKAQRDLITQTKTGAECRVDAIGVRDLSGGGDGATATVIANLIVSETQNSMATNSGAPRAQFAMVREGDQWRIRSVEPF